MFQMENSFNRNCVCNLCTKLTFDDFTLHFDRHLISVILIIPKEKIERLLLFSIRKSTS